MGDMEPGLDPLLARAVEALKAPVELDAGLDRRVLAVIGRERAPRVLRIRRRVTWVSSLAAAAAIVLLVLMNHATAPESMVRFAIQHPYARSVTIVGDFNDWDPAMTPMARSSGGQWKADVELAPGRYRYSYLVNGSTWVADPVRPAIPDGDFDAPTSLLTVQGSSP